MQRARCYLLGETAVVLELEPPVTLESQKRIWRLAQRLVGHTEVVEAIPGMNNITVILRNPQQTAWDAIERLQLWWEECDTLEPESREVSVPVVYGGEYGPDLGEIARHSGLSEKQVVELHSSVEYVVWFPPGPSVLAGRKPGSIRWRRRGGGSCWGVRRWRCLIRSARSRCCCVPATECVSYRKRRAYVKNYPRRYVYLGAGRRA